MKVCPIPNLPLEGNHQEKMKPGKFKVSRADGGTTLQKYLQNCLRLGPHAVGELINSGCVYLDGKQQKNRGSLLKTGMGVSLKATSGKTKNNPETPAPLKEKKSKLSLIYLDQDLAIINKPAGLTTVHHKGEKGGFSPRDRKFLPPTLQDILPGFLASLKKGKFPYVRAVHRLDKETSGIIAFALNPEAEGNLGVQMREKKFKRKYLTLVRGELPDQEIRSHLIRDRGDGRRGSNKKNEEGELAITLVRTLERFDKYSLVECELETGRTHQVRIHLGENGAPICGERIYDRPLNGKPFLDGSGFKRVALHAMALGLSHPKSGKELAWECPLPEDMRLFLEQLLREKNNPGSNPGVLLD